MPNLRKKKSRISAITLKTRKVKRQPHVLVISADPKKKKAACRASYNASPEKKRAASCSSIGLTLGREGSFPGSLPCQWPTTTRSSI